MLGILTFVILSIGYLNGKHNFCDRCICQNTTADCTGRKLKTVPNDIPIFVETLLLGNNKITDIANNTFNGTRLKVLDLSDNYLSRLHLSSFNGLESLTQLRLGHNKIKLNDQNYPAGVFRPLQGLEYLDISSNDDGLGKYPDAALSDLVSLQDLRIDGIKQFVLSNGFSHLKTLNSLEFTGHCNIGQLEDNAFENVSRISILIVRYCSIHSIGNSTFGVFDRLHSLDLSYNLDLTLDGVSIALQSLTSSNFRVLDITSVVKTFAVGVIVTKAFFQRMNHLNITDIYMDQNRFELIEDGTVDEVPKSLQIFTMRDNRPTFGNYLLSLSALHNLVCLDASYQYQSHNPISSNKVSLHGRFKERELSVCKTYSSAHYNDKVHSGAGDSLFYRSKEKTTTYKDKMMLFIHKWLRYERNSFEKFCINVPRNLKLMNCSACDLNYQIPELSFCKNSIKVLDLSTNLLNKWNGPIQGITTLETLDLSNNRCDYVSGEFFTELSCLKNLNIGSNFLAVVLERNRNGSIFGKLENLETLIISSNQIRDLPGALLLNQTKLRRLDLSKNILKSWTLVVDHMDELTYIDLSSNMLTSLPKTLRDFSNRQSSRGKKLTVDLSDQTLRCTCYELEFLRWMLKNNTNFVRRDKYMCTGTSGKVQPLSNLSNIITNLEKNCKSWTTLIVVLSGSVCAIATICLVGIVYRFRWKLRYLYYLTRNRYNNYAQVDDNPNFNYDAFVSFSDKNRLFVTQEMIQKLEGNFNLRLCIHQRDFLIGESIAVNISNAIMESKKTIVVLSNDFLKSYWCDYELNMANMESISTGRNVLILIVYEDIEMSNLPKILADMMKNNSYIEYTENVEGNVVFWDQLTRAVMAD